MKITINEEDKVYLEECLSNGEVLQEDLGRWFKEKWETPSGKKDYSETDENTFRPTKKVSEDTPSTWSELTPAEKAAARKEKNTKGRVSRYKKKIKRFLLKIRDN